MPRPDAGIAVGVAGAGPEALGADVAGRGGCRRRTTTGGAGTASASLVSAAGTTSADGSDARSPRSIHQPAAATANTATASAGQVQTGVARCVPPAAAAVQSPRRGPGRDGVRLPTCAGLRGSGTWAGLFEHAREARAGVVAGQGHQGEQGRRCRPSAGRARPARCARHRAAGIVRVPAAAAEAVGSPRIQSTAGPASPTRGALASVAGPRQSPA